MARIMISGMENDKNTTAGSGSWNSGTVTGSGTGIEKGNNTGSSAGIVKGTGKTAGNKDGSTAIKDFFSSLWGSGYPISGNNQNNNQSSPSTTVNQNQQKAETSLEKLKNDYSKKLRDNYEHSAERLKRERDEALRENWILQQREEAALPERMAAAGINGGAAETTLANLRASYQGNRNDIRKDYMNNLEDFAQKNFSEEAQAQREYNAKWLEYLLSLAEMEEQRKYAF